MSLPRKIQQENEYFKGQLATDIAEKNFIKISENIVSLVEKISSHQTLLKILFEQKYLQGIHNLVFRELQLLTEIIKFSSKIQSENYEKIIKNIENLEKNSDKLYSVALTEQIIRLEKQKEIF